MSDLHTKSIRFPKHSYVGFDPRPGKEDDFPLGFMTEDGTDKAAEKRKSTVDQWADRNKSNNKPRTLPNEPMAGFRLSRSIRRNSGWGQGNVKWRIEDPRGFELEISSPNLAQIISTCVIDGGMILNECMWARLGGENVLVPTDSDLYLTTKRNSERQTMSVKPSSVKIGNTIVLQNGVEGVYLGKMYHISRNYGSDNHKPMVAERPKHLILGDHNGKPVLHDYATFKVAEIVEADEMTVKDAELAANKCARWTANKVAIPEVIVEKLEDPKAYANGLILVHMPEFDDEWCVFGQYSSYQGMHLSAIDKAQLDTGKFAYKRWHLTKSAADRLSPAGIKVDIYNPWHGPPTRVKSASTKIDVLSRECFRLYRVVKTEAGNTFDWPVGT